MGNNHPFGVDNLTIDHQSIKVHPGGEASGFKRHGRLATAL